MSNKKPNRCIYFLAGILWRYRYARYIKKYAMTDLSFGWYLATGCYEETEWWLDSPDDAVSEELSCWDD